MQEYSDIEFTTLEYILPSIPRNWVRCKKLALLGSSDIDLVYIKTRAATILRLLTNETIRFNTRVKKCELGLRNQLKIDVKSTAKSDFHLNLPIYLYIFLK